MPPPPALRCSPGRDLRADSHKRGRSLESGLSFKEKEDGLALFDEMQKKEQDTFLLQSNDDFEDLFGSKLKYFSDCKLGVSVFSRGESSDILNADGEKNDYDWLLTPPETPLFPSLDDAPPGNLLPRGRPRTQPISISRSSTMEKNYTGRSSRGSQSPQRFSPSPRPGTGSSHHSRGRTSPAPSSSPTPSIHNSSPSRKPSPPSVKSLTPGPRSSTPTPRRLSTGSSGTVASLRVRGSSPVQSSRGLSSSPKISAWQSNIPGFSTDVPPNLRTSLVDRPASYVRGSSPASRNGRDLPMKGKLSMSPTDHKSVTSPISQDRDRLSSHSKGSLMSSGDDDADSLQSIPVSTSDLSTLRRAGTQSNNKAVTYSRKPNKMVSSSSAPKRSFDYAMRHLDQRKTPQNMFRPLLSGVPTTTLYAGKPMSAHEAMVSKNSSIATSSTASSDQASGIVHDMEGSGHVHHDIVNQYEDKPDTDVPEEVFVLDKMDGIDSDAGTEMYDSSLRIQYGVMDEGFINATEHDDDEDFNYNDSGTVIDAISKVKSNVSDSLGESSPGDMTRCSECGCKYSSVDNAWNDVSLCPECSRKDGNLHVYVPEKSIAEVYLGTALNQPDKRSPQNGQEEYQPVSACVDLTNKSESRVYQFEDNVTITEPSFEAHSNSSVDNSLARSLVEEVDRRHMMGPLEVCQRSVGSGQPAIEDRDQFLQSSDTSSSYFNDSEVDGISILLKRSSSSKGPIYQGRTFKASSISYDDPSYARESGSFTRSSMGLGSTSASSSVDLSSGRQIETRIQRQLSSKKIEMESYNLKRLGSHSSETSNHAYQTSCHSMNTHEDDFEISAGNDCNVEEISGLHEQFHMSGSTDIHDLAGSGSRTANFKEVNLEGDQRSILMAATSEVPGCNVISGDSLVTSNGDKSAAHKHGEAIEKFLLIADDIVLTSGSQPGEELPILQTCSDAGKAMESRAHRSLHSVSEIEIELEKESDHDSDNDYNSAKLDNVISESHEPSVFSLSEKAEAISVEEDGPSNNMQGFSESTVMIQGQRGNHVRSLTLEEATDTILFCRSIVQNIVDQAAIIALEKEKPPQMEPSRPILGKTNPQRKELRGRSPNNKRTPKSHKPKQKQTRTEDPKPPPSKFENDENIEQSFPRNVGLLNKPDAARPPKLESKCNCTIM
ncbi:unnamed protein product [Rhodiola kirilowii]